MKFLGFIIKWVSIVLATAALVLAFLFFIPPLRVLKVEDTLSLIIEIIFILVVIVIGGEIYQYGMFMKEIDKAEEEHRRIEAEYEKVKREYKEDKEDYEKLKSDYDLRRGRTEALTTTSIALSIHSPWLYNKALELLRKQLKNWPTDRSITFNIDYLICNPPSIKGFQVNFQASVELYNGFIEKKINNGEYDADLGDAFFNRACSKAQIYSKNTHLTASEKNTLKEEISYDLNQSFLYTPSTKTDDSKNDSDFDGIRKEQWFIDLWS